MAPLLTRVPYVQPELRFSSRKGCFEGWFEPLQQLVHQVKEGLHEVPSAPSPESTCISPHEASCLRFTLPTGLAAFARRCAGFGILERIGRICSNMHRAIRFQHDRDGAASHRLELQAPAIGHPVPALI